MNWKQVLAYEVGKEKGGRDTSFPENLLYNLTIQSYEK